jgi:murein DD-endopeptidase MepM/ murein hydrolase activator NlpD
MQNNDKFYTFLLTHSSKTKIYIRRIEVSKSLLHSGIVGSIVFIGIAALAVTGVLTNGFSVGSQTVLAKNESPAAQAPAAVLTNPVTESIDYSRPVDADNYSFNSGGPVSETELTPEDEALENELRAIQVTSNPAFVPSMWAHLGKINNEFGFRRNPFGGRTYEFHPGMDIDGERGDIVVAPANGTILKAGWTGGYGNLVEVDHGNGLISRYGHLSKVEVVVGDAIQRGQLLGFIGSTGRSTGPHLHYEIRLNDKPINPRRFLPPEPVQLKKPNS